MTYCGLPILGGLDNGEDLRQPEPRLASDHVGMETTKTTTRSRESGGAHGAATRAEHGRSRHGASRIGGPSGPGPQGTGVPTISGELTRQARSSSSRVTVALILDGLISRVIRRPHCQLTKQQRLEWPVPRLSLRIERLKNLSVRGNCLQRRTAIPFVPAHPGSLLPEQKSAQHAVTERAPTPLGILKPGRAAGHTRFASADRTCSLMTRGGVLIDQSITLGQPICFSCRLCPTWTAADEEPPATRHRLFWWPNGLPRPMRASACSE
jgi:hypothetical protein